MKIRFLIYPGPLTGCNRTPEEEPQVEKQRGRNEKESGAVGIKRDEKGAGMSRTERRSKKERYVDRGK